MTNAVDRPSSYRGEQSPADIHARSSKSMGSFGHSDTAQTAHDQLVTALAHCTSTGEQTDITQAVHTSRALWLAWPAKPRTCKSTKVLGAVSSTTDMVQLASTSTVLSTCSPKAARREQDILCFHGQWQISWPRSHCTAVAAVETRRIAQVWAGMTTLWETTQQLQNNLEAKPLGPLQQVAGILRCYGADDLLEHPVADVCPACYTHGEKAALRKELLQTGGPPSIIHEACHGRVQRHAGDMISTENRSRHSKVACSARHVPLVHAATGRRRRT